MIDHMRSRNSMVGGEDPIKSKKLEVSSTPKMETPSTFKGDLRNESKEYKKYVADTDKKGRRNAAVRNLKKFGGRVVGGAAALVGGYYGLTREPSEKETKKAGGNYYRRWRWEK